MRVAFFSAHEFEKSVFAGYSLKKGQELHYFESRLDEHTARLAEGFEAVCVFVNDKVNASVVEQFAGMGVKLVATRSAGYNHIDLEATKKHGIQVVRVPAYSPYAVAEHAVAMILTLNRKTHRAYNRVREGNFALDGLLGFDLHGKTAGLIGTGKIGAVLSRILLGFGMEILAYDVNPNSNLAGEGITYLPLEDVLRKSDIVSLHCPLLEATHHLINAKTLERMKPGAMLINTSRGGLVDTPAVIEALKTGRLGALGLDVYEEEAGLFFEDQSGKVLQDDVFARLLTFPNVLITGHQAFFTAEALQGIAMTTVDNIAEFEKTGESTNQVRGK